uniref:Membrane progestin receptor gamma-B-like n=1 Tax=Hirondellea gigas TaxID=1518452 RepID=A0A2P2I509_9CRUS
MKLPVTTPIMLWSGSTYVISRLKEVRREITRNCKAIPLIKAEQLTERYRERAIIGGYRANYSCAQVVLSLFHFTNETVNIWTHLIPTIYFAWKFAWLSSTLPLFSEAYMFPLACYTVTAILYPLASCMAHAFSCTSPMATYVCFFLDYGALALYSWGAALVYYAYTFPEAAFNTWYASLFLPIAAVNCISAMMMACFSRFVQNQSLSQTLRLLGFILPFIWDSIPLIYRLLTCDAGSDSCESFPFHVRQFIYVSIALFFYASHIPEIFAPGCFDFIGHSHNLLHLFGIIGTHEQIQGAMIDMSVRRGPLKDIGWIVSPAWSYLVTPGLLVTIIVLTLIATQLVDHLDPFYSSAGPCCFCSPQPTNGFIKLHDRLPVPCLPSDQSKYNNAVINGMVKNGIVSNSNNKNGIVSDSNNKDGIVCNFHSKDGIVGNSNTRNGVVSNSNSKHFCIANCNLTNGIINNSITSNPEHKNGYINQYEKKMQ